MRTLKTALSGAVVVISFCSVSPALLAQTQTDKENFVRNAAVLLGSQQLCGYSVNPQILADTFHMFKLLPEDIEPGGEFSELFERRKKHIAAVTDTDKGLKDFCATVQDKLGSLLLP